MIQESEFRFEYPLSEEYPLLSCLVVGLVFFMIGERLRQQNYFRSCAFHL